MKSSGSEPLLELGASNALRVRSERIAGLGRAKPLRLLYASDLHLFHRSFSPIVDQLEAAVEETAPDAVLLGGDLVDRSAALPLLETGVARLARGRPVWAIGGNHDRVAGRQAVRRAVEAGGGRWLEGASVAMASDGENHIRVEGTIRRDPASKDFRVLCAHDPKIFPAALEAGYALVLAGHLHGGQWVIAQRDNRLYPGAWFYRWNGLRFEAGRGTLLVSRGLSDTLPFRWNCPREVLLCEIY